MQTYIVAFKTTQSAEARAKIEKVIKDYGTWGKVTPDIWVVVSEKTAKEIRDNLLPLFLDTDTLLVVRSGTEAAWHNSAASNDWLKKNL